MEAILANTSANAAMVNLAGEVGVIGPGKLADIVIWDSDPIADIAVLQRPQEIFAIIKDGGIADREAVGGFRQVSARAWPVRDIFSRLKPITLGQSSPGHCARTRLRELAATKT
jgi:hypothetical protein